MNNNKNRGFSLLELLIAVVIIGILLTIALPSYKNYVLRAQATEGVSALANMRVKMEQYFQDNRTYVGACVDGTLAALPHNLQYFTLSCPALTATEYTIQADGVGFTYTLDQTNQRATTAAPSGWTTNTDCWVISESGVCQ